MKKNWIIFILICGSAYAFMFWRQISEQRDYDRQVKEYKTQLAIYEAEVAEIEEQKEAARQKIEAAKNELLRRNNPGAVSSDDNATSATTLADIPNIAASDAFEEVKKFLTVTDVPTHVVDTPLYRVVFSELGARPISWEIKSSEYVSNVAELQSDDVDPAEEEYGATVQLIPQTASVDQREFPLEFAGATVREFNSEIFTVTRTELDNAIRLELVSPPVYGLTAIKEFVFHNDTYEVDLTVSFTNEDTRKKLGREQGFGIGWQGGFGSPEVADRAHGTISRIIATDGGIKYNTLKKGDAPDIFLGQIDWAGQEKKFFAALLIPSELNPLQSVKTTVDPRNFTEEYMRTSAAPPLSVELLHPSQNLETGEKTSLAYQLYVGPKNLEALQKPEFILSKSAVTPSTLVFHQVPMGMTFIRPVSLMLLKLMRWLHDFLGAWGLAIICTTIIVRIIIYPLTHWAIKNQARTMIEQQKIRPEMEAITKKFKSDPMKKNQAVMQLYREHNVNPLGMFRGCIPILLQMPVLLALYVVFAQSVELRGQSFLWIQDLSGPDSLFTWKASLPVIGNSFNLLPIIMAFTNYLQMRIMRMPATDEMQEKIQKQMTLMMPVMFIFFLYALPSGLILYWIVSNCFSILQSIMTKRIIASHMAQHEAEKKLLGNTSPGKSDVGGGALTNN